MCMEWHQKCFAEIWSKGYLKDMNQHWIDIKTEDGICDAYMSFPVGGQNLPGVILYMDAIGLRRRIFDMADKLAEQSYFVIAPNLFYRSQRAPIADYTLIPDNLPDLFKKIMPMASELTPDMAKRDAHDFLNFFKTQSQVNLKKIGVVGYCMGGAQALRAAGNYPHQIKAAASFHAGNLCTEADASPSRLFPNTQAEILIAHADQDKSMPPEQVIKVKEALQQANLKFHAEIFIGCQHGWTMSDLPAHNQAGEQKHWQLLFQLFERTLKN
jgi:carboxymethylenebutenolidase